MPGCRALLLLLLAAVSLAACSHTSTRYLRHEDNLRAGNPEAADKVIEAAESEYGASSQVLYWMDRGMTLHLAGRYSASTALLDLADQELERLYTRRLRTEARAFLTTDAALPYEGDPFEQVMINALKALNYALLGNWSEALVEARRLDHRLNVLADAQGSAEAYRDDPFARYISGILYEATGDLNNAFIAYRKSYEAYRTAAPWLQLPMPRMLAADLLRTTEALHLDQEHAQYKALTPDVRWQSVEAVRGLAQVVLISYNGRAPRKDSTFIDLPISLDALKLVVAMKAAGAGRSSDNRVAESLLYGLNGQVVRVALPEVIPQKTQVRSGRLTLTGTAGAFEAATERVQDIGAMAKKSLSDRFSGLALKAVARATVKHAMAEGIGHGAQAAAGREAGPLVKLLVGAAAKAWAVGSEEADTRNWRTLPDEIHVARLWVPAGTYELRLRSLGESGALGPERVQSLTLKAGETRLVIERVVP